MREEKNSEKNRREIVQQIATTGVLGSVGLASFSSVSAAEDDGDGITADPDMNLPSGGGGSASDEDYDATTSEANDRYDTSYDYTELSEPTSNKTDLTVTDTVLGNEFTVDGDAAKVTYKYCDGASRQMVVSEVSITVESSNGTVKYSQWAGISEDGCFYIGDSHGCIQVRGSCDANQIMEAPQEHMDAWFTIANALYDRAEANRDEFADAAETVLRAIIAVLAFFLITLVNVFSGATS